MSFPKYPEYKDSGVVWLGEVPDYWESWKVSHSFLSIGSGTTPNSDSSEWYDGTIPWVTTGELRENVINDTFKKVNEHALNNFSALRIHPAGSLAIAMYGATIGRLGILGIDATTNQACCVLSNPTSITTRFMFYWFLGHKEHIIALYATGGGQPNINQDIVRGFRVPVPSIEDQNVISSFLDGETAKIDALVAEQEKLIELLKEKRQAVISHAVTKGLDPNVPMKDSCVEWLGEVPEHWLVRPLKSISTLFGRIGYRGYTTADIVANGEGAISLSPSNLIDGDVSFNECTYITWEKYEESPEIKVNVGDVVMVKTGSTFGKVAYVSSVDYPATINPQLVLFKNVNALPRFLFFVLSTPAILASIAVSNSGSTIPTMSQATIGKFLFGLPPIEEQRSIVKFLEFELIILSNLHTEAQQAIDLLKERRSSLISAAVTGKIDVRGLAEATQ